MSSVTPYKRKKLFLLGPYAALIHWVFEFIILTALPVLAAGAIFSVIDLLTNGFLTHISDGFSLVWASGQAAAIELLFFSAFMRVAAMAHQGRWGKMIGWLIVGLILAIPSFQASVVYGMVHTFGITVPQAIAQIGLSDMEWIVVRALAVIFVGALEGIAAYSDEGTEKTVEEQIAEMAAKVALSKASAEMNQARLSAWAKAAKGTIHATLSDEDEESEEDDPGPEPQTGESENITSIGNKGKSKRKIGKRVVSEEMVRDRIFKLLGQNPNMPSNTIMARVHCSVSTVSKYKNLYKEMHPELYVRNRRHTAS